METLKMSKPILSPDATLLELAGPANSEVFTWKIETFSAQSKMEIKKSTANKPIQSYCVANPNMPNQAVTLASAFLSIGKYTSRSFGYNSILFCLH